ncbi:MAG: hypothetical protein ACE5H0_06830 [Bacteroidota bacterium]
MVNPLEEKEGSLAITGGRVELEVRPYEIVTLKLDLL